MWLVFFFILPALIYRIETRLGLGRLRFASPASRRVGIALFIAGGTLGYLSAYYMVTEGQGTPFPADATRRLVVAGPYRYVRNPMAMGSFAQGVAVGIFRGSPLIVLYALTGAVGWDYLVRPWEEDDLLWRFGEPYARYRDNVHCWVPTLSPCAPEEPS